MVEGAGEGVVNDVNMLNAWQVHGAAAAPTVVAFRSRSRGKGWDAKWSTYIPSQHVEAVMRVLMRRVLHIEVPDEQWSPVWVRVEAKGGIRVKQGVESHELTLWDIHPKGRTHPVEWKGVDQLLAHMPLPAATAAATAPSTTAPG
jgi:hypothetical protein